jgi:hypothetical protein
MTTEINGYGTFLRDALAFQINTYRDNNTGEAFAPAFVVASCEANPSTVLRLEGDTVTAKLVGTCELSIEPTEYGFVVLVPHVGDDEFTAAWQSFVYDALSDDPAEYHGDEVAATIRPAVAALADTNDHIGDADDLIYLGDIQDDQSYATVEVRPMGLDKE